jgi:hypothetical protein
MNTKKIQDHQERQDQARQGRQGAFEFFQAGRAQAQAEKAGLGG